VEHARALEPPALRRPDAAPQADAHVAATDRVVALQRTAGNHAVAQLLSGGRAGLQRFGLPVHVPPPITTLVDAADVALWAGSRQSAAELRQGRLDVDAVRDGDRYRLVLGEVTMDAPHRTRLKEALRMRTMERVREVRAPFKAQLEGEHDAAGRRAIQDRMRTDARPFLDELRDPAQPPNRFDHPVREVRDEVLAALELDGEGRAEDELADQQAHGAEGPRARARSVAGLPEGAWCGAFAYTQQRGAGLSDEARAAMHFTGPHGGIDAFLEYENRQRVLWTGARWMPVHEYHAERGSLRKLVRLPPTPTPVTAGSVFAPQGLDIQPGDIVLIDNFRGIYADHITQCRSYDPATGRLETIAGNEGGGAGEVRASQAPRDLNQNPAQQTVAGYDKPSRVYAYGRFSIVDYEVHTYLQGMPPNPTESPEAMAARSRGRGARH
jgi:hypothetical protein